MASSIDQATLRREILTLADSRGPDKTFCPSEVARRLSKDWRPLMSPVRDVARELVREGRLQCRQNGVPLWPESPWRGAIRLQRVDSHER